jgi:hypothetical protein
MEEVKLTDREIQEARDYADSLPKAHDNFVRVHTKEPENKIKAIKIHLSRKHRHLTGDKIKSTIDKDSKGWAKVIIMYQTPNDIEKHFRDKRKELLNNKIERYYMYLDLKEEFS